MGLEFIGTAKEDGIDARQREDARNAYEEIIAEAGRAEGGAGAAVQGDLDEIWHDIRDHWTAKIAEPGTPDEEEVGSARSS